MCIIFVELYLLRPAQETGFLVCGCDMIGALLITISLVGTDVNVTLISSDYLNSRFMGRSVNDIVPPAYRDKFHIVIKIQYF